MKFLLIALLSLNLCAAALLPGGASAEPSSAATAEMDVPTSSGLIKPLGVGDTVPDVTVTGLDSSEVNLGQLVRQKPTVLVFYRGGWCPYCTTHLSKLAQIEDYLTSAGFQIVAISPDAPEFLQDKTEEPRYKYTLYSDSKVRAAKAFGLAFRVDDATVDRYLHLQSPINLEQRSGGEKHHVLPVPAAYVVDTAGKIRYAFWDPDYKRRVDVDELWEAAKQVR